MGIDDSQSSMLSFVAISMEIKLALNASIKARSETSVKWKETTRTSGRSESIKRLNRSFQRRLAVKSLFRVIVA